MERAVDSTYEVVHSPLAAISPSTSSVEFLIPGDTDYISPRHTLIEITFKILNADGTDLKKDTDDDPPKTVRVATIQAPAFSLFKSVEIKLCNEKISDSFQTYHLKSYMMVSTLIDDDNVRFVFVRPSVCQSKSQSPNMKKNLFVLSTVGNKFRGRRAQLATGSMWMVRNEQMNE